MPSLVLTTSIALESRKIAVRPHHTCAGKQGPRAYPTPLTSEKKRHLSLMPSLPSRALAGWTSSDRLVRAPPMRGRRARRPPLRLPRIAESHLAAHGGFHVGGHAHSTLMQATPARLRLSLSLAVPLPAPDAEAMWVAQHVA